MPKIHAYDNATEVHVPGQTRCRFCYVFEVGSEIFISANVKNPPAMELSEDQKQEALALALKSDAVQTLRKLIAVIESSHRNER